MLKTWLTVFALCCNWYVTKALSCCCNRSCMGPREPLRNVISIQECPSPICPQLNCSSSANQELAASLKSVICPPTFRHRCRTEKPKSVYPEPNLPSFKPLSTCPPCPLQSLPSSCSLDECSALLPKLSCPKVECPLSPSPLPFSSPSIPESNPFPPPSPNPLAAKTSHSCPPCPSPQPLRSCNPDECPSPAPPPPCPSLSPQTPSLTGSQSVTCPPPPPCPNNAGINTVVPTSQLGCPQQQDSNIIHDCSNSNECNEFEDPIEEKRYQRRYRNRRYRTNYRLRKAKVSRRLSRSVQNKTAKPSDHNSDFSCNNAVLAKIMKTVLSQDVATSKQKIQEAAEEKLLGKFNVICSKFEFAYVLYTNTFCEASNKYLTCYAFRASNN